MKKKYSELRKILKIDFEKEFYSGHSFLTHYFQNYQESASVYYEEVARDFFSRLCQDLNIASEPDLNYYLPLKWDVPFPPPASPKFKFIDLFAGIGGFRIAFQNLGGKCVFSSEWNKFSQKTYEVNFGEVPFGDITKISEHCIPDHDILCAGFPCQPFSIAGVSKKNSLGRKHGFLDETQGTLFFDIVRIINFKKPTAFLLENVKNLISHDKGRTFLVIKETLKELGYFIFYKILDGKHFVPQHRERIIIVGFREKVDFKFPDLPSPSLKLKDLLEPVVPSKYTLSDHLWNYLKEYAEKHKSKGNGFGYGLANPEGITRTLSARYYKDGAEILIFQNGKNPRRLTPRECARLQGFPDKFIIPVSDNQAYRQFGNSVVVPLIQEVGKEIINVLHKINGKPINKSNLFCSAG